MHCFKQLLTALVTATGYGRIEVFLIVFHIEITISKFPTIRFSCLVQRLIISKNLSTF